MAKLDIHYVLSVILCFILFVTVSTEKINRREKRQYTGPDGRPQFANSQFKEFYPRPTSMDEFRKQRLYPVRESEDITNYISSSALRDLALSFNLPFFGFKYTYAWIHKDGYIAFSRGLKEYRFPIEFPIKQVDERTESDPSLIAPWFSSQDIPRTISESGVYSRLIIIEKESDDMLRERLILDFREGMIGAGDFTPTHALIVTWRNVTFASRQYIEEDKLKTNTYQVVLATDELRTYAMFNYDNIEWTGHGDTYDGTKGPPSFVGFNGGNRTRSFELRPFSQNHRITLLQQGGHGNKLPGRWYFQINEEVWPGSCVNKELDPNWKNVGRLTFFPRYGNMLGGTMVNITGPCFGDEKSRESVYIRCRFDIFEVDAIYRDVNHATCLQPYIAFHGYIDLSVSVMNKPFDFVGKYYIQPPELARQELIVRDKKDREENPSSLTILWEKEHLTWKGEAKGSLYLWGYRENVGSYPSLTFIDVLAENAFLIGKEIYELDVLQFEDRNNRGKTDITFGFISMNLTDTSSLGKSVKHSPIIWSRPMPLAWYFRRQWEREHKYGWKKHFCEDWFQKEKNGNRFAITVFRCPCTLEQANIDRGRFTPDSECNVMDKSCDTFHKGAAHCIQSGRPSVDGAGQLCCYDDHGELMRTGDTMYGGRPSRSFKHGKHPYKLEMMLPTLSHWFYDVMPFFFCCKWTEEKDSAETCAMYKYWRTSQDCTSYQSPGVASVYGDPHFHTFDGYNYTFNGRGEFVLVRANTATYKLDIHGRFEHIPSSVGAPPINGTKLTAVAAKDNHSSIVEFRLRPDSARWQYHLFVLVDKEYVFFWDDSLRIQTFKGVTIYQPSGTWNMSHLVAMFDSGAGIEVRNNDGNLLLHTYLPLSYINLTAGLFGNWSRDPSDDFVLPGGRIAFRPPAFDETIHNQFGMKWRLNEINQLDIGTSLFHHDPIPFGEYDDENFKPEFRTGRDIKIPENFTYKNQIYQICADSSQCQFDLVVTGDLKFSRKTKENEGFANELHERAKEREIRCPELVKPLNGRKSEIRYHKDTVVRFTCEDGYRLVGHQIRKCRDIGLWTWGVDAECISESTYTRRIAGMAVGIIIPIVLVLCLVISCFILRRRRSDAHYTGERGMPSRGVVEIKSTANRRSDADYESKEKMETET